MIIRREEHILDLLQLLVAYNVNFSRTRARLDQKAELFVFSLALSDDICSQRHGLDALDFPVISLFDFIV